jgi:hypothetical protein
MANHRVVVPRIVKFLFENPDPINCAELARKVGSFSSYLSPVVRKLEEKKWIATSKGEANAKLVQLYPGFREELQKKFGGCPSEGRLNLLYDGEDEWDGQEETKIAILLSGGGIVTILSDGRAKIKPLSVNLGECCEVEDYFEDLRDLPGYVTSDGVEMFLSPAKVQINPERVSHYFKQPHQEE